jgi:hypothetical protein
MNVPCPACQSTEGVSKLPQPFQFSLGFMLFAFLGGGIGGLFWGLGQENKYRCERCERIFYSHTRISRVFWLLAVLSYSAIGAILVYAFFFSPRH